VPATSSEPTDAAALLVNDDGRVLLHLRDAHKPISSSGRWALPGGGREPGESLDETIARELREEAGLTVPGLSPFAVVENTRTDGRTVRILVYAGRWNGNPAVLHLTEGIMLRWTDPAQMRWLTMDPGTEAVIRRHQADPRPQFDAAGQPEILRMPKPGGAVPNLIGAHLYLERKRSTSAGVEVFLGQRHPSAPFAPSHWHALAGKCEFEGVRTAVVREAAEEAGLEIDEGDLTLVHTVHLLDPGSTQPLLEMFFSASRWRGEPQVLEPDRCTAWGWWPVDGLPDLLVDYTRTAIQGIARGDTYTQMGWS
jgi:8-oxo-dGTP pyrophosphatase MutT (NUDIX family)